MARMRPYAFPALVRRMFRELDQRGSIFDLPQRAFFTGAPGKDLSVRVHGHRASTPFGPAAGPHTQLAQNIVSSWLVGGRVIELKTIQVNDELSIPRPCIDMRTVGFNIEWSQELKLEESLEEYAKASMLISMLIESGRIPGASAAPHTIYDLSVGYDLAGITSPRVQGFMRGMLDATAVIEPLRAQIPDEYREYRALDFQRRLSDTVTLSTFHGCPPAEIERIVRYLQRTFDLHVTVKLNPTLLGKPDTIRLLHDVLGYDEVIVPDTAFQKDLDWDQMAGLVDRLGYAAEDLGLGFGVKFTNTLVVENREGFLPADHREMYLSGPPLHVLAIELVRRFRRAFGDRFPISFSGGIDRVNFPDTVALGLVPVTVCTDLLKPGGYGRARAYLQNLVEAMDVVGARTIGEFVRNAFGGAAGDSRAPTLRNAESYADDAIADVRYTCAQNNRPPASIESSLSLFDCIACDKCVPACPNDANFTFAMPTGAIPIVTVQRERGRWRWSEEGIVRIEAAHQIAHFADFCNDCGNCDVFCPEDGDPHLLKPRVFGSHDTWAREPKTDGFLFTREGGTDIIYGRFAGVEYTVRVTNGHVRYSGPDFDVSFAEADPEGTFEGEANGVVVLTCYQIMNALGKALLATSRVNYVNALLP